MTEIQNIISDLEKTPESKIKKIPSIRELQLENEHLRKTIERMKSIKVLEKDQKNRIGSYMESQRKIEEDELIKELCFSKEKMKHKERMKLENSSDKGCACSNKEVDFKMDEGGDKDTFHLLELLDSDWQKKYQKLEEENEKIEMNYMSLRTLVFELIGTGMYIKSGFEEYFNDEEIKEFDRILDDNENQEEDDDEYQEDEVVVNTKSVGEKRRKKPVEKTRKKRKIEERVYPMRRRKKKINFSESTKKIGDEVWVRWRDGKQYLGIVKKINKVSGKFFIKYTGYSDSMSEWITENQFSF